MPPQVRIESVAARAYTVPTDKPEADGTLAWDKTTIAVVHVSAGGVRGIGYTYADASVVGVIGGALERAVRGRDAMDVPGCFAAMQREVRNLGRSGLAQQRDRGGGCRAVGCQGEAARAAARRACSVRCATRCRSTAAAASPAMTTRRSARPARRLGRAGRLPMGEDEDRQRSRP